MRLETGTILEKKCNAIVIPSSAHVVYTGRAPTAYFDDGVPKQILKKFPELGFCLAKEVQKSGNYVFFLTSRSVINPHLTTPYINANPFPHYPKYHIINFPVKPSKIYPEDGVEIQNRYRIQANWKDSLPGFMAKPQKGIVEESLKELEILVRPTKWSKICIPAFAESEVNEMLQSILDDRYVLVSL